MLVSGKATLTVEGKPHTLVPGSYTVLPSKKLHELSCDDPAGCVSLVRRSGPPDVNWVKGSK
jgi:quercetin dioxygenase-like cupin family protein